MSNEKEVCCAAGYSRAMCFGCTADLLQNREFKHLLRLI